MSLSLPEHKKKGPLHCLVWAGFTDSGEEPGGCWTLIVTLCTNSKCSWGLSCYYVPKTCLLNQYAKLSFDWGFRSLEFQHFDSFMVFSIFLIFNFLLLFSHTFSFLEFMNFSINSIGFVCNFWGCSMSHKSSLIYIYHHGKLFFPHSIRTCYCWV